MKKDLYEILGVSKNATKEQIDKAYKQLSLKWHPDRHPEDKRKEATAKFQEISEAYRTLSDAEKKNIYDHTGQKDGQGHGFGGRQGGFGGFDGFDFGDIFSFTSRGNNNDSFHFQSNGFGGFDDIFNMFTNRQPQKQQHILEISVEDSFKGTIKQVMLMKKRYDIKIPAGTKEGDKAELDANNILIFKIVSNSKYTVNGVHLIINHTISYQEFIANGRVITLTDIDGSIFTYKVGPEHKVFTAKISIPGRGLWYNTNRSERGMLVVNTSINI